MLIYRDNNITNRCANKTQKFRNDIVCMIKDLNRYKIYMSWSMNDRTVESIILVL